jgi:hypothetical protein
MFRKWNKSMRLKSALEDFWQRTVESSQLVWERLLYVSRLRGVDGVYHHWGLERTYGSEQAQRAMQATHELLFLQVLQTPIRQLAPGKGGAGIIPEPEIATLLVPDNCDGGSIPHFWSVYDAVTTILAIKTNALR